MHRVQFLHRVQKGDGVAFEIILLRSSVLRGVVCISVNSKKLKQNTLSQLNLKTLIITVCSPEYFLNWH